MAGRTYKLEELARAAGTSPRTVRYYVQRGLLPAPTFRGKDTAYEHEHLVRLKAIRRLQEAYLPLDAVAAELDGRTIEEIARLGEGRERPKSAELAPPKSEPQHDAVAPAPGPVSPARAPEARLYRRLVLAPGVELDIADDAPAPSRDLVERIVTLVSKEQGATR